MHKIQNSKCSWRGGQVFYLQNHLQNLKYTKYKIQNADGQDDRLFKYSSSKSKIHKIQNTDGEEDRSSKYKIILKI